MGRDVITTETIHHAGRGGSVEVSPTAIVTDAARELAADWGVRLRRGIDPDRQCWVMANWKMNLPDEGVAHFGARVAGVGADPGLVLFPPDLVMERLRAALEPADGRVGLGVQNVHSEPRGAFTGETSARHAIEAGASWSLVGHSERRRAGETDEEIAARLAGAMAAGLRPVLCIGETARDREMGRTLAVLRWQTLEGLQRLTSLTGSGLVMAYEPVWAIGSGRRPAPEEIRLAHQGIRRVLSERFGESGRDRSILYGGSVTATSAPAIMRSGEVDGFLVGGASLDSSSLLAIADCCRDGRGGTA